MARQRVQSALLLTIILNLFLIINTLTIKLNNNNNNLSSFNNNDNNNKSDLEINNNVMLGRKFGDRISPRNRIINDSGLILNLNNINNYNNNSVYATSNNNNNNSSRTKLISRSISLSEQQQHQQQQQQQHQSKNNNDDNNNQVTLNHDDNNDNIINLFNMKRKNDNINIELINNETQAQAEAHRLEMSTEFFVVPTTSNKRSTTIRPGGVILAAKPPTTNGTPPKSLSNIVTPPTIVSTYPSGLRKEPWVVPILVLSSLAMIMMASFEIFVLCKAWRTSPSRRHLFLGQMLLLGLFSCAGLGAVLTATPTLLSCATVRFGAGVAFALVFASLLVKCVFLISLNGGVYLPAPYQGLLLLFAVLIQVAVGAQWLLTSPPGIDNIPIPARSGANLFASKGRVFATSTSTTLTTEDVVLNPTIPLCKTQFSELLLSLIYVVFLILFVAVLAIKSRGIRDNYREATYIGLAIGGSIPIWLGWTLCGLIVADRHRDACLAFGLVATSTTVFLVMFMPKGRQLAAMGKEGLYVEDREERFSSLSRAGSGYSPSFFHFKPIKYGVMGGISPTNTNTGNGTTNSGTTQIGTKQHQAVATLGGAAPPPSYTRMYHYFPATHLTHPFCYYPTTITQQPTTTIAQTSRYPPGLFMRPDDSNLYTTLEPTLSSNPNVFFQRGGGVHPGMMY